MAKPSPGPLGGECPPLRGRRLTTNAPRQPRPRPPTRTGLFFALGPFFCRSQGATEQVEAFADEFIARSAKQAGPAKKKKAAKKVVGRARKRRT